MPANWHARSAREGLIRRRYAVRGIDRTDRPAWRRLQHADFLDTRRAVRVWRRCDRPSRPWTSDNHRPRAKEQSVPRGNARLKPLATARLKASRCTVSGPVHFHLDASDAKPIAGRDGRLPNSFVVDVRPV